MQTHPLKPFIDITFPNKPAEKRADWVRLLASEEYETVEELKAASEAAWTALPLPLAIKDALNSAVKAFGATTTTTTTTVAPVLAVKGDTRPLTQLNVIVFDVSASMNSKSIDPEMTRLGAAKILFHTMVDKLVGHECPHNLGLVLFGENIHWTEFTRDYESFHDTLGDAPAEEYSTKLWDAILYAGQKLVSWREANHKLLSPDGFHSRIFCLTDGEDNASRSKYWEVAKFLQEENIVLDSIPLATDNEALLKCAQGTGGLTLKVTDMQKGASLFEREAVIKLACRDLAQPLIKIEGEHSFRGMVTTAQEDIKTAAPQAMTATKVMTASDVQQAITTAATTGSAATRRLLKEYKALTDNPVPGFQIFMTSGDVSFWKLIMTGPLGTPYADGLFAMYVRFPADYPFKTLDLRFTTPIYHPNVNNDGKMCLEILNNWSPSYTMSQVLRAVIELVITPDPANALDAVKANLYSDDKVAFNLAAVHSTKTHASETLDELKVKYNLEG